MKKWMQTTLSVLVLGLTATLVGCGDAGTVPATGGGMGAPAVSADPNPPAAAPTTAEATDPAKGATEEPAVAETEKPAEGTPKEDKPAQPESGSAIGGGVDVPPAADAPKKPEEVKSDDAKPAEEPKAEEAKPEEKKPE